MTRFPRNLVFRAFFAIVLSCITVNLFAQSSDTAAGEENAATETESSAGFAKRVRIDWADFQAFDSGYESYVALHPSGLIVEVHSSGQSIVTYTGLYYHIGRLDPVKGTVHWGPSRRWVSPGTFGSWPAVAITREGYVILTFSNAFTKDNASLRYSVGTIDPEGDTDQAIDFKVQNSKYDNGFHNSVSVNYNGTIAEAHEADGGKGSTIGLVTSRLLDRETSALSGIRDRMGRSTIMGSIPASLSMTTMMWSRCTRCPGNTCSIPYVAKRFRTRLLFRASIRGIQTMEAGRQLLC
jgi:hypothetical protein